MSSIGESEWNKLNAQKDEFNKKLITLVFPIAFMQFMLLALVSAFDVIMLGIIDQNSLSVVSLAGQVQFVFNLFLVAITIKTSIFVAHCMAKDYTYQEMNKLWKNRQNVLIAYMILI